MGVSSRWFWLVILVMFSPKRGQPCIWAPALIAPQMTYLRCLNMWWMNERSRRANVRWTFERVNRDSGWAGREWVNCERARYLTTYHERDTETGYDYRGARFPRPPKQPVTLRRRLRQRSGAVFVGGSDGGGLCWVERL